MHTRIQGLFGIASALTMILAIPSEGGITNVWTNAAGGRFDVAGNWNPAGPPGVADMAVFNQGSGTRAKITFPAGATTNAGLKINKNNADNRYEFFIADGGTAATYDAGATVFCDAAGAYRADLLLSTGTLVSSTASMSGYDSQAKIVLDGPGTVWRIKQNFTAGQTTLDLYVQNGAQLEAQGGGGTKHTLSTEHIDANKSRVQRISVTGPGSSLIFTNLPTEVIVKGTTVFEVLDGAIATFKDVTFRQTDTTYTNLDVVISNASLRTTSFAFGGIAGPTYGHLKIMNSATATCSGDFKLDEYGSAHARATVDNAFLEFGGIMWCGKDGRATLVVTNGGLVVGTNSTGMSFPANSAPTKPCRITVTSPGSILKTKHMTPGGNATSDMSTPGNLDVVDGGLFVQVGSAAGLFTVWSKGVVTLDSGTISNASTIVMKGVLQGKGLIVGNVNMTATNRPGGAAAAGTLSVGGSYTQSVGVLELEIGGTASGSGYDVLAVTNGVAITGGKVAVTNLAGFKPPPGITTYDVVTGSNVSTNGATITLPPADGGVKWSAAVVTLAGGGKALRVSSEVRSRGTLLMVR